MALVLLGAMSLGTLQVQKFQQLVDLGRQAGQRLALLQEGAERYTRDHGPALLALKSRASCEDISLSQAPLAGSPASKDCEMALEGQVKGSGKVLVSNAFQPSVQDLQALGYVNLTDALPFPHGDAIVDGRTGQTATPRWAVSVQCHANCDPAKGNGQNAPILKVMLYNTQPFFDKVDLPFGYGAQLKAMLQELGPKAMLSMPGESPEVAAQLRSKRAAPVPNPLEGGSPGTGVPGVLASHQLVHLDDAIAAGGRPCGVPQRAASGAAAIGPGASGSMCRDGSSKPTARWDFNGQALDNVGQLQVVGNADVGGSAKVKGDLQVGTMGHRGATANIAVNHGDLTLQDGRLTVLNGFADFSDQRSLGDSRLGGLRLATTYGPGMPCNPVGGDNDTSGGNLGLYFDGTAMHVMVCRPHQRSVWGGTTQHEVRRRDGVWTRSGDVRSDSQVHLPLAPS
jgi:hypothetical protein